jgi:putative thioredoxin
MSDFSIDVSDADFDTAVLAASHRQPVLVDFWAPWCQPCLALKPLLEKLAIEYGGQFVLAKINSDENPASGARYGVRSIPAVKAFVGGELVDEFTGALPERQLREFIERLLPSKALPLIDAAANALDDGELDVAQSLLDDAQPLLRDESESARFDALKAKIKLARAVSGADDIATLAARVTADGTNLTARRGLALALTHTGDYRLAGEHWLAIVRQDRHWEGEAGRKGLLDLFTLLGGDPAHAEVVRELRIALARTLN